MTKIEDFGAKADLTRITVSITNGSSTITTAVDTFTIDDVGKIICIKEARNVSTYSDNKATLTAMITCYTDKKTVGITTNVDYTNASVDAYYYTNNYDAIQEAIDYCVANDIGVLYADSEGVFGIDPWHSDNVPSDPDDWRNGLTFPSCSLSIKGAGKEITNFKWCVEDDFVTSPESRKFFSGFIIGEKGEYAFEDFTMLAPDRLTTEVASVRNNGFYVYNKHHHESDPTNGTVTFRNIDIIGDANGNTEYPDIQWAYGTSVSTPNSDMQVFYDNIVIKAGTIGISQYDTIGDKQFLNIKDTEVHFTGSPLIKKEFVGDGSSIGATLTNPNSGAPYLLTVTGIPGFSFYDFFIKDGEYDFKVILDDGVTQYVVSVDTVPPAQGAITSPTTALVTLDGGGSPPPLNYVSFVSATDVGNTRFGHSTYIHPSVTVNVDGFTSFYATGFRFHVYSSGGTKFAKYHMYNRLDFYDENNPYLPGYHSYEGFVLSAKGTSNNVIRNSRIVYSFSNSNATDYQFYDTKFIDFLLPPNFTNKNGIVFYGNVNLVGCILDSSVYSYGDGKEVTLMNSNVTGEVGCNFNGSVNLYNTSYEKLYKVGGTGTINPHLNASFKENELIFKYLDIAGSGKDDIINGGMYTTSPNSIFYLKNDVANDFSTLVVDGKDGQTADVFRVREDDETDHFTIANNGKIVGLIPPNGMDLKYDAGSGLLFFRALYSDAGGSALLRLDNTVDNNWSLLILDAKGDQAKDVFKVRDSSKNDKVVVTKDFGLKMSTTTDTFNPPNLTSTEIAALTAAPGDVVYNTTTNKHQGYNGSSWNDFY